MKIKVLLFTSYGANTVTPAMGNFMKRYKGMLCRINTELIEYIENNSVVYEDINHIEYDKFMKLISDDSETIVTFKNHPNIYYVYNKECNYVSNFSIVEVDTTRPWTIEEYDGAEGIKYLDDMVCVDKELNYWSNI